MTHELNMLHVDSHILLNIFDILDTKSKIKLLKTCKQLYTFKFNIKFYEKYHIDQICYLPLAKSFKMFKWDIINTD